MLCPWFLGGLGNSFLPWFWKSTAPTSCLPFGSERKVVRHTTQIQVQTGILAVMIRKERQSQEMTVFCLQGTVFMGGKREIRSGAECSQRPPPAAVRTPKASKKKH